MKLLSFFEKTAQVFVIGADDFIKPDNENLSDFISVLSEEERERFNRYKNEKAQFTFLTARVYLRFLLSEKILHTKLVSSSFKMSNPSDFSGLPRLFQRFAMTDNLRFAEENKVEQDNCQILKNWIATHLSEARNDGKLNLIIETTPSGKPYLKDYPSLFFNLSHTDNLILIAIADSLVGVDVEKNERNADKEAIIKHFFSEREQQSFFSQPEKLRQQAFVKGWTRKEAILKATGEGLSAMKKYEVSFEIETKLPIINNCTNNSFKIKDFIPLEGYVGCLAVLNN